MAGTVGDIGVEVAAGIAVGAKVSVDDWVGSGVLAGAGKGVVAEPPQAAGSSDVVTMKNNLISLVSRVCAR